MTTTTYRVDNGVYTVRNRLTGDYRTFKVDTRTFKDGTVHRVLSLLTGPNNDSDYRPIGFAGDTPRDLRVWRKVADGQPKLRAFVEALRAAMTPEHPWAEQLELHLAATCRRCNRTLTTPQSVEAGIGPGCAKMEGGR